MNQNVWPPGLLLRFFRWFCHPKLVDHIEGDLIEDYNQWIHRYGKRRADIKFAVDVLLLFRPGIIKPIEGYRNLNNYGMVKSYFKVGYRNLLRRKGYSVINIVGLAVGMGVSMLIGMWMYDELSYNKIHQNYDRIAQVGQHMTFNGDITTVVTAPAPLGLELKTNYGNEFKHVVRMWFASNHTLSVGELKTARNGAFIDSEALELFSFKMLKGSWASLDDAPSIVLSESTAKGIFGDEDPINKLLRIDNAMDVKVTGIFEDLPANSQFHTMQFLSTMKLWLSTNEWMRNDDNNWNSDISLFVEIQPYTSFEQASSKIQTIKANHVTQKQATKEKPELFLQPMSHWHLYSEWKNGRESLGRIQFVWLFGIIGVFVLLLACINFMNLSTAQSERRAKEVGIRKSIGSVRIQLIYQFLTESFLVVGFSFIVAMAVVSLSLPWFNLLADKQMTMPWMHTSFWLISLGFVVVTSLLAGSYPAFYLSSFQPVKVLKGAFKAGRLASIPRKALVVLQFTVSVGLIIGTIGVWKQIQFAKDRPVGYSRDGLIMVRKTAPEFWGKFQRLKNKLERSGAVVAMGESNSPATDVWTNNTGFNWKGKDPDLQDDFATLGVTHEYGKTMGWEFVMGRDYSREFATDSSAVILNEAAVKFMGLQNPVDEEITWNGKKYKVIGVIKNVVMTSPYEPVKQMIVWMNYEGNVWINIRLNPNMSTTDALIKVEQVFQQLFPAVPFDFKFVDQEYAWKFSSEEHVGKLASVFAVLAILISCIGLFGMASFVAEQRKKEIGIRKILGASAMSIWRKLSSEFVVLVSISCLVAIPVSGYFLNQWLRSYDYHTEVSLWVFVVSALGAVSITLLTVSFHAVQSAVANPVNSLKSE